MRFLLSSKENVIGEPVIPAFPVADNINTFLGINTFTSYSSSILTEMSADPYKNLLFISDLINKLVKEYPGVPQEIHEKYVMGVAKGVSSLSEELVGKTFSVIISDTTKLRLHNSDETFILWKN